VDKADCIALKKRNALSFLQARGCRRKNIGEKMKRALMMLVAVLAMTAVASVQAADVKIEFKNRDVNQKYVPAQNVKYSIADANGEIVVDGAGSEVAFNVEAGKYEVTVEQKVADSHVRYGSAVFEVADAAETFKYEITETELRLIEDDDDDEAALVIASRPVANAPIRPLPTHPQVPSVGTQSYNNWGILGLTGALVATAIALGVDDDCPKPVSGVQR
jgi:hypothetical protein